MITRKQIKANGLITSIVAAVCMAVYFTIKLLSTFYYWLKELVSEHFSLVLIFMIIALLISTSSRFFIRITRLVK